MAEPRSCSFWLVLATAATSAPRVSGLPGWATAKPGVASSMPMASVIAQTRGVRLIRLKSPMAQRERAGTFVGAYEQSQNSQLQHQPLIARYVTSDAKETLVTNYKSVIECSVIPL